MYQQMIRETVAKQGRIGVNPRHVEAWMRLEHSCLDGLGKAQFDAQVAVAISCIDAATTKESESLAESFAL
jgi:hypothetical protein